MGVKVIFPELDSFIQDLTLKWDITASDRRRQETLTANKLTVAFTLPYALCCKVRWQIGY